MSDHIDEDLDGWEPPAPGEIPEPISDGAVPPLLAGEFEAKILQRQGAMNLAPCYRCDHTPAAPDPGCPCCLDAHTPDADGHFTTCTADEFATMRREASC